MEIKIDPEFKSLIPSIAPEELSGLEESIIAEGCRDELILWGDILLDGHNRLAICEKHGIKYMVRYLDFPDRDAAKLWIICNQLSRRNLSPEQIAYLRGLRYQIEKKEAHRPEEKGGQSDHVPEKTAEKLSKEFGVSEKTIRRDAKFAEAVDKLPEEEKKEVLSGKSKKTKKEIAAGKTPIPEPLPKLGPPSNGLQFVRIAIMNLEQIKTNDTEREEAFQTVLDWLEEHMVIPQENPVRFKKYMERMRKAWDIIPKRAPALNDGQRDSVQMLAAKIFWLLEPFIKVRPSDEFLARYQQAKN